jgi:phenylacetate-CoA ligase
MYTERMHEPFFHLRELPGLHWPRAPSGPVAQSWAAYRELDRLQWLSAGEIAAHQLRQLQALLLHCWRNVPYYQPILKAAGYPDRPLASLDDLRRLPFLTRQLYQTHFAELRARTMPAGIVEVGSTHTSGTNGVPIKVLKTNWDCLWWNAFYLRDLEWSGLDPRGRLAAIRLVAMRPEDEPQALAGLEFPGWSELCYDLLESGPAFAMDIRQAPRRQLGWLRQIAPDYLLSQPSMLEHLAGLILDDGYGLPGLKVIQAIGEPLTDDARARIEAAFHAPVKNLYSTNETGYIASTCPAGHGLHVHAENILAEVLDEHDRPCEPGETGRLVYTALHSFLVPLIRYDVLDDVTLGSGPCPCGRGLPLWSKVDGRRHTLFHLPAGGRKSSMGATLGLRKVGGVHQFQIVQRAIDHIVLRVIPNRDWSEHHAAAMRQVMHRELPVPVRVDIERHETLPKPRSGKLRVVVVEMDQPAPCPS